MSATSPIKKRGRPPKVAEVVGAVAGHVNDGGLVDRGESQMLVVIDHGTGSDGEQVYAIVGEQCSTVKDGDGDEPQGSSLQIVPVVEEGVPDDDDDDDEQNDGTFADESAAVTADEPNAVETFRCSVCRQDVVNQREFFIHLKSHYEPISGVKPEPKKRGRKRKSETQSGTGKAEAEDSKVVVLVDPVYVVERKTRSGRISRPRKCDDMISLSPPRIKTEPKFEPLDEDLDVGADAFPEHRAKSPAAAAVRTELGDEMENELPVPEKPKQKRLAETKPRKPRRSLASYKRVQSGENGSFKLECEVCHKLLANSTSLAVHQRIHKGERPFKCDECGRCFRQFSDLGYHMASIHSDKKAYQCEFCGKEFSRKYSLNIHQKIHTGIRDYKCEVCNRGFRAAIYLQEHRRIHTGEKPFLCDVCGRGFRIKSDMYRHRLNVHYKGNKPGTTVYIKAVDDEAMEEVMVEEGGSDNEEEAQFVTITTKDGEEEEGEEGGSGSQTMHRLVFISENEAILV